MSADRGERRRALVERLAERHPEAFGRAGAADVRVVRAPGRVNLIGEHTDYNLGLVMPAAISLETWIASVPSDDGTAQFSSLQEPDDGAFDVASPGARRGEWVDYPAGVAWALSARGVRLRGVRAVVDSDIPVGSGLSSSAALELAAAWTLAADLPPMPPLPLAPAAQNAENADVGVNCGLMDQFASAHGVPDHALLFDCRSLEYRPIGLPDGHVIVAIDTRSPHKLGASEYNARRAQCEEGVRVLARRYPGIASLRDVSRHELFAAHDLLDDETFRRCRHVVEENERVVAAAAALPAGDLVRVGRLFAQSHASLRDLYEVSSPELDALVEIATAVPGVVGARMTGAGFGGCTVNIVRAEAVEDLRDAVAAEYPARAGREAGFHVVEAVAGAGPVPG